MLHSFTNYSHNLKYLHLKLTQLRHNTSYQNLFYDLFLLGVAVRTISMLRHEAGSLYNSYRHCPIYTKFIMHVEGPTLNTSMHQYCVKYTAPPTGHRKSASYDKHYPIYMKFRGCVLYIIHCNMTCNWWVISSPT